jgi:DNA-binding NarL/FixJ family response regulator
MKLLERDPYLAELCGCLDLAGRGTGQLVFLGGESGIGKTSLSEAFLAAARANARTAVISCDGLKMPGAFGALHDIAEAIGPEVEALIAAQASRDEIFRAVLAALRAAPEPVVLIGDDAHWSDEAALDAFDAIDARADARRVSRHLREMGARNIPRGPRFATRANAASLTARELEVLQRLAAGESNREIADRLYLSPKTVGHHVSSILNKLEVATRREAVRHAQALGLLQDREPTAPT